MSGRKTGGKKTGGRKTGGRKTGERKTRGQNAEEPKPGSSLAPEATAPRRVTLYCDGACRGNPGVGGYGAILHCGTHEKVLSGAAPHTTNNRMELAAAIAGLEALNAPCKVKIVTDSQYLKCGITEWIHKWLSSGWRTAARKAVLNRDLWERLHALRGRHEVEWEWVRGHSGHEMNERCDRVANEAIDALLEARGESADGAARRAAGSAGAAGAWASGCLRSGPVDAWRGEPDGDAWGDDDL